MSDLESQARQAYEKYKFSDMINQSIDVLTHPKVVTFEKYEKQGDVQQSLVYVGTASVIAGLIAFIFGLVTPWVGGFGFALYSLILTVLVSVLGFYAFAYLIHYVGKTQGGTGTQAEAFYTAGLYAAPLMALSGLFSSARLLGGGGSFLSFVVALYMAYLGYLAVRASMNLEQNPAIITVVAAIVGMFVASLVIGLILGVILAPLLFTSLLFR